MFLELPAELRIHVYQIIIERASFTAKNVKDTKDNIPFILEVSARKADERLYRGLIFSCKRILGEYKSEASKFIIFIDPSLHQLWWGFKHPLLIAPPRVSSLPTHIHITLPVTLFRTALSYNMSEIARMMPPLMVYRQRTTFSIAKSAHFKSKLVRRSYLVGLYNSLCEHVCRGFPGDPSSLSGKPCPLDRARKMWLEKGYGMRRNDTPPCRACNIVALHIERGIVVCDRHMSEAELRGADSGHLWEDMNTF